MPSYTAKILAATTICLAFLLGGIGAVGRVAKQAGAEPVSLCVMTFNLRYASPKPPNSWPERRPVMRDCIRRVAPDLIGTQEGLYEQLKDLAADLPEYEWVGLGRDGGSRGEFMAVFYRRDRFEAVGVRPLLAVRHPGCGGLLDLGQCQSPHGHLGAFSRAAFRPGFYFWNTHLDHAVELARQKGAALIVERAGRLKTDLPLVMTGDFNAAAGASRSYEILVKEGGFATCGCWRASAKRENQTHSTDTKHPWRMARASTGFSAEAP